MHLFLQLKAADVLQGTTHTHRAYDDIHSSDCATAILPTDNVYIYLDDTSQKVFKGFFGPKKTKVATTEE